MERHVKILNTLCRVCGSKIRESKGYLHPKKCTDYEDELRTFYGRLADEDPNTYPSMLCISCKRKLDKMKHSSLTQSEIGSGVLSEYDPHSDKNCNICSHVIEKKPKSSGVHWKYFDKVFHNYNFIKCSTDNNERSYCLIAQDVQKPSLKLTIQILGDMSWKLFIFNDEMTEPDKKLSLPRDLNDNNLESFCSSLLEFNICKGNSDFLEVIKTRVNFKEPFPSSNYAERIAWVESKKSHAKLIKEDFDVIRSVECEYLTKNKIICDNCKSLRQRLSTYKTRATEGQSSFNKNVSASSKTNIKHLNIDELRERLKNLQVAKKQAMHTLAVNSVKLERLMNKEKVLSDNLTIGQNELLQEVISKNKPDFEEGTPQWLLWTQQAEQASKKDSRSMKWHPLIIRWCLSIYMTSPSAYRHISSKQNNFLALPHVNTLKKYINFTKPTSGFNPEIIAKVVEDFDIANLEDYERNVSLTFDEVKIKSGLVYKRGTGEIIGFTEMGELNEEIKEFVDNYENVNETEHSLSQFASYVIVFMVRGLFIKCCSPFAYFASPGFTGDQLCPLVIEATRVLEAINLKVRNWTSDGATPNRKLYSICSINDDYYFTSNFFDTDRKIFFMSDPPHLIKTTRNNIENSHGNAKSRKLTRNKYPISWMHIVDVFEWDLGMNRNAVGLRMLPKLKEEHIRLTPQHRMSVKYAAQVLSKSMANALRMQSKHETKETIKFIEIFDRAFDCLNVMRKDYSQKIDRHPYRNVNDERFEFLQSVILYLDDWENEINSVPDLRKEEKSRFTLSHQTVWGWKMTISSFIELAKLLLQEAGPGKYLLSEKFSQDPLEEHFARHRRMAGCNDNPSLIQFGQQEVALHVMRSDMIADLRGNTSGRQSNRAPIDVNDLRLPKKRTSNL